MKKALLYSLMVFFLLFSCSKSNNVTLTHLPPSSKKYAVTLNVSGFTIIKNAGSVTKKQVDGLKTNALTDTSSNDTLNVLYYAVYDSTGILVNKITQKNTDANFGAIIDNLPAGTYSVALVAGKTGLSYGTGTSINAANFYYSDNYVWHDTFFKTFSLTVSGGNVDQNVTLERFVGQLEVNINDAIPSNVATIVVNEAGEWDEYRLIGPQGPNGISITTTIPTSAIGTTNFQIYSIVANTATAMNVVISCYDASNNLIGSTTVPGVTFIANTRTILSGDLFGGNTTFQISLNDTWNPLINTIHY